MRRSFPIILTLLLTLPVFCQSHRVDPHHNGIHVMADLADARIPPFETPPSIACVYGMVANVVPGCPVLGTTELPTGGSGIIAVVNAFDYPTAQGDLNVFSKHFHLPACNASNPCFSTVFAAGTRPPTDGLWAANASEVIEYAHAFAPSAKLVLVEAADSTVDNVWAAVLKATQIISTHGGKGQVIMAFGGDEDPTEPSNDSFFTTPGIVYISGNEGAPNFFEYPCTSPNVLCVGGTAFNRDRNGNFMTERAAQGWNGGQSAFEPRPSYQDAIQNITGEMRGVPDVAFVADVFTSPELYYDSTGFEGFIGWQYSGNVGIGEAGWAAAINRAGDQAGTTFQELGVFYGNLGNTSVFRDIIRGAGNGTKARPGWDFVTGLGVPASQ